MKQSSCTVENQILTKQETISQLTDIIIQLLRWIGSMEAKYKAHTLLPGMEMHTCLALIQFKILPIYQKRIKSQYTWILLAEAEMQLN